MDDRARSLTHQKYLPYADTKAATPTLTANGTVNGVVVTPATTSVNVVAASASVMAFVNCSLPSGNDSCGGQPIAMSNNANMTLNIMLLDAFNNPAVAGSTVTVTLTNNEPTFSFGTGGATASVATGSGTSTQIVLRHGVNGGTDTLTAHAAAGGFSDATLQAKSSPPGRVNG